MPKLRGMTHASQHYTPKPNGILPYLTTLNPIQLTLSKENIQMWPQKKKSTRMMRSKTPRKAFFGGRKDITIVRKCSEDKPDKILKK